MLTYLLNPEMDEPLYEQLYRFLKQDIERGELKADTKLPSKRTLAQHLGVSVVTIETAYQQLVAEGYVNARPKRGYFVNPLVLPIPVQSKGLLTVASGLKCEKKRKIWRADLTNRQTLAENFPFSVWTSLMRLVLREHRTALMEQSEGYGVWALRSAITEHLRAFRGMMLSPEQVIIGAGTEYLYGLLIQLLGLNKRYAIADPGYDKLHKICASYGVESMSVSTEYHISELEKLGVDIVHSSPSHHFPTGHIMPVAKRYELLAWAGEQAERYIIEDDYDSEFRFVGQVIPALHSIDQVGKVIYMNTFSKTLASTVRIAYMVLPPLLAAQFQQKLGFYASTVSNFEQYALAEFIRQGSFEKHINRMRAYYQKKRDKLLGALKQSCLADRMQIEEEDSGLHFIVRFETVLSDEQILIAAEKCGIRLTALATYYRQKNNAEKNAFVIGYSNLTDEQIEYAVKGLERIFE